MAGLIFYPDHSNFLHISSKALTLFNSEAERGERLGALGRFTLREVHHVDGSLLIGQELLDGLVHRAKDIGEIQLRTML